MCEIIDITNVPEGGFTAKEDIFCYKILFERDPMVWTSPYYPKDAWVPGAPVSRTRMRISDSGCVDARYYDPLWHVWRRERLTGCGAKRGSSRIELLYRKRCEFSVAENTRWSEGGFHTFTGYMNGRMADMMERVPDMLVKLDLGSVSAARCVIPAGSRYYVSDDGTAYVSDSLVVDDIVYRVKREDYSELLEDIVRRKKLFEQETSQKIPCCAKGS